VNTFCGDTVEQIDGKIEIQIGPLCREQYLAFLPDQPLNKKLKDLIQTWCSPTLFIDVRLILDKNEVAPIRLDSGHEIGLGQGAFLMPSAELQHNRETRYALLGAA
jgi:type VI secretion system protein ImpH